MIGTFSITKTTYLASTSAGEWGRGPTLFAALKKANALTRAQKIKPKIKVLAWVVVQDEDNRLTQAQLDHNKVIRDAEYKVGDFYEPCIDSAGGMHYMGQAICIDLV